MFGSGAIRWNFTKFLVGRNVAWWPVLARKKPRAWRAQLNASWTKAMGRRRPERVHELKAAPLEWIPRLNGFKELWDRLTSRDSRLPWLNPAGQPVRQKNRAIRQFVARVLLISFFDYHSSFN